MQCTRVTLIYMNDWIDHRSLYISETDHAILNKISRFAPNIAKVFLTISYDQDFIISNFDIPTLLLWPQFCSISPFNSHYTHQRPAQLTRAWLTFTYAHVPIYSSSNIIQLHSLIPWSSGNIVGVIWKARRTDNVNVSPKTVQHCNNPCVREIHYTYFRLRRTCNIRVSHTLAVLSMEVEHSSVPRDDNEHPVTVLVWPTTNMWVIAAGFPNLICSSRIPSVGMCYPTREAKPVNMCVYWGIYIY